MNNNTARLTHAIEILQFDKFKSVEQSTLSGDSTKQAIINSFNNNPNPIEEHVELALHMLQFIKDHARTDFDYSVVEAVETDLENSEGYIAFIPKLYEQMFDRAELMEHLKKPTEFYPLNRYSTFSGMVEVIKIKDGKVFAVANSGHLLTWYDKNIVVDDEDNLISIEGTVSKFLYNSTPWETRLTKVKYV